MKIVDGKDFIPQVKKLIVEYTERLGRDLAFQHINEELQNPATKYTAPEGVLPHKTVYGVTVLVDKLRVPSCIVMIFTST